MKKRDLFLADSHILELEHECTESVERGAAPLEDATSPNIKDGGRRKAKDVELLYEELQKELWSVVRESLHSATAGPNLGLVVQVSLEVDANVKGRQDTLQSRFCGPPPWPWAVDVMGGPVVLVSVRLQVLQQEEQADKDWALGHTLVPGGPRPRRLRQRWQEAVEEAADAALPPRSEYTAGELHRYLDRLRARVVEDLGSASKNVVSIYPEDYRAFQVSPAPPGGTLRCRTFHPGLTWLLLRCRCTCRATTRPWPEP